MVVPGVGRDGVVCASLGGLGGRDGHGGGPGGEGSGGCGRHTGLGGRLGSLGRGCLGGLGGRDVALHGGEQHLRDIDDLDLRADTFGLLGREPVGDHDATERAPDGDPLGARRESLLGAVHVDPRPELLLHPHPGAAGAAAEGLLLRALHLLELDAGKGTDEFARRGIDVVVPTQVARVVVGHRLRGGGRVLAGRHPGDIGRAGDRHQLLVADQAVEQLGVVDDLELGAELGVLVLDRVEAVRTGHDHLGDAEFAHRLDVLRGQSLEEHLVARTASRVTGAGLAVAQDGKTHSRRVEQLGHGAGGLLGSVLVGTCAADPEEPVDIARLLDVLTEHTHGEGQVLGPIEASTGAHAPRVALALEVLEEPTELRREG